MNELVATFEQAKELGRVLTGINPNNVDGGPVAIRKSPTADRRLYVQAFARDGATVKVWEVMADGKSTVTLGTDGTE